MSGRSIAFGVLLAHSLSVAAAEARSTNSHETDADAAAAALVKQAERAGLEGDADAHAALVDRAIRIAPNYAPARWLAGQVMSDGAWIPVEAVQAASAEDPRREAYRTRRAAIEDADGHAALAKWCEREGLADEARFHWISALDSDPNNRQALAALGLVRKNGRLTTRDAVRGEASQRREAERRGSYWARRLAHWEKTRPPRGDRTDLVLEEVRAIDDPHAVPPFEALAQRLADVDHPRFARRAQLCEAFVEALDGLDDRDATAALVRLAVLAPHDGVRLDATEALLDRPKIESVPLLLAGLRPTAQSDFKVRIAPTGEVAYTHDVLSKGREADYEFRRLRTATFVARPESPPTWFDPWAVTRSGVSRFERSTWERRVASMRQQMSFARQAAELESRVAALNEDAADVNRRITPVLRRVTGQRLGDEPRAWWDYWSQFQGYELYEDRPTYTEYDRGNETVSVTSPVAPRRCECFVAGTPVWTKTGRAAIETLRAGDFVLAKDTETGELGFRAVLATTVRQPSPTIALTVGDERLVATSGHPFWVVSHGWRMAKQLSTGDVLATVDGPASVTAIEPSADAEAFNLVVEGVHDYFVGERGVLAHDNTPRERGVNVASASR